MSPWARLLDYLADRYGILFLVSAGNVTRPLPIEGFGGWSEFENANPKDREKAVLTALADEKAVRTLLSPAEALKPVMVGAMHDDAGGGPRGAGAVDPFATHELPNVSSALGLGHRKVVKPDIHLPGGREHLRFQTTGGALVVVPELGEPSGLKAASPDAAGSRNRMQLTMGTSAATALATRAAHMIYDALVDRGGGSMHADMEAQFRAVVVKACWFTGRDGEATRPFLISTTARMAKVSTRKGGTTSCACSGTGSPRRRNPCLVRPTGRRLSDTERSAQGKQIFIASRCHKASNALLNRAK